jgi:nitroreductase
MRRCAVVPRGKEPPVGSTEDDMTEARFSQLDWHPIPDEEMVRRARVFREESSRRRTVRHFSDKAVPKSIIEDCILSAGTAPSGAHREPWRFVAVSDPETKRRIREAAENEEREFYEERAPADWLEALAPLGTDADKPFLEIAPWLIVVFAESYGVDESGERVKNYYVQESVGIATGMLISAAHAAGLATLTHTPSPMRFLGSLLGRPDRERPFLILVVGHPADGALVPSLERKPLKEIATFV